MIYLELFWTFFKIGLFTFGGGYAMIPLIESEVLAKGWLLEEELMNWIAISESTPGPFAINIATHIGTETSGLLGALCATFGLVLPSFVIILLIATLFMKFKENKIVKGCMNGLKPAVVGLIASAVLSIGKTALFGETFSFSTFTTYAFISSAIIFLIMLFLELKKKVHPIIVVLSSAGLGIVAGYLGELISW